MKRIISILLSIIMCFSCMMVALPVKAVPSQSDVKICKGQTFEVIVLVPDNITAKAGSIEFAYDDEFEFISGDWTLANTTMKRYTSSTKKGVFTFDKDRMIIGNVFVLELKASDDIALGEYYITYSVALRNGEGVSQVFNDSYVVNVINQDDERHIDVEIAKGETIKINVSIPESTLAKAGSISLDYDDEFEFISGNWLLQNTSMERYTASTKKGVFTFDREYAIIGSVFEIVLKSNDTITLGKHSIAYSLSLRNADGILRIINCTYTVNVVKQNTPMLTGIIINKHPTKTTYFVGQPLDITGLELTANYDDGSTAKVTSGFTTSGFDSSKEGTSTVTVSYGGKSTTFDVTIKNKSLTSISVSKEPNKTVYLVGQSLDIAGLEINANYDDGSNETLSSGFLTSGFDSSTAGLKTITVTYRDKLTAFEVTVEELTSLLLGDTDGDGAVTIIDATYIQRQLANIPIPFDFIDAIADTDEDGSITIIDATYIQRWLANLPSNDKIGKSIR